MTMFSDFTRRLKEIFWKDKASICDNPSVSKPLSGIDLAVVGKSGCGETALMSKLALLSSSLILRFRPLFVSAELPS
jgi:ABC-type glutathione transport system ATPase component